MTDNLQHIISDPRWAEIPNDRKQRILTNYVVDTYGDQFTSLDEDRQQNILNNFLSEHGVEIDPEFSLTRIGSQAVRQAIQGAADIVRGVKGLEEKLPEKASQELSEGGYLAQMRKRADETTAGDPYRAKREDIVKGIKPIEEYAPEPLEGSSGIIEEAVGGMARFAPSMATSAVSGPAGVASTFVQLYGMKRKEYADQGIESDRADTAAMVSAIAQTPVEFLGNLLQIGALKNIAKSIGKPIAKKAVAFGEALVKGVLGEGAEEYVQQYPDEIANIYAANPDLSGDEIAQEVKKQLPKIHKNAVQASKVGAVGGGLLAGAGGMVGAGFDVLDYRSQKQKTIDEKNEQKKEGADLYKVKIIDALKAGTITVDELQERKSSENFTPEQVAIFDEAISEFQASKPKATEDKTPSTPTISPMVSLPEGQTFELKGKPYGYSAKERDRIARERTQQILNQIDIDSEQDLDIAIDELKTAKKRLKDWQEIQKGPSETDRIEAGRKLKEADRLGLKLDADERKRLEALAAEPKQMKPEGKRARVDYSELTKTGEWVEPSEPTQAKKHKELYSGFKTEKGSTYTINKDNTTIRDKAKRPEHPGEEGIQPKSKKTWYVTYEDAIKLSEVQAKGEPKATIGELKDGRIGVKYLNGKDKGKFEKRTVVEPLKKPAIGLMPVEYFGDKYTIHFGNKITELYEQKKAKKREPEQPQDEVAETVPPKKTAQVVGLKTSEKGQRPKPYPFDQTVDEYIESEYQRYLNSKPLGKETDFKAWKASDRGKTAAMDHEMAVRDAVKRGITVRERVLKGYPELSESKKLKSKSQTDLLVTGELQKEPWEMTQEEYIANRRAKLAEIGKKNVSLASAAKGERFGIQAKIAHHKKVKQALSEGKPVPDAVIKEYPDLAPKPVEPTKTAPKKAKVGPYFTIQKAKRLVRKDFSKLSDNQLQKDFVKLRDYNRYIADHSWDKHAAETLLKGGYFKRVLDPSASGFVPTDIWLANSLRKALDDATTERNKRIEKQKKGKKKIVSKEVKKKALSPPEKVGTKSPLKIYPDDRVKVVPPGGLEFYGDVKEVYEDTGKVDILADGQSNTVLRPIEWVASIERGGIYRKRAEVEKADKARREKKPPRAEKAETKQEKGGAPTPKKVDKKAAKLLDTLKDETGSSELANDIMRKAGDLIIDGVETFGRFRREMQKAFKEIWDKIRKHMRALWDVVNNQRGEIKIGPSEKKQPKKKTADDILKDIFAEPKVKKRVKEKKKFDKELRKDTEDVLKHVSNLKHIWKFIRPGKLTRQGKQDLSYMWDLMLSVPEFFKQKIGAVNRIYQAQQDRMDEYHEHIYQMENHDTVNVVESFKRLKKDSSKARQAQKYLVDADRTGIGFHTKLEDKFWTVYNQKNEIVGEYESNITPDNVDRGEVEAISEMVKAEAEYLTEQGFTPEQIESITAFRLTTNKGFELLFRSMRNLIKKYKEAGIEVPKLKTFEDGKSKTISLKEAMAIMGDMRGTYFPRIRQKGKYILTAIKGDDRILRTFKTANMRDYIKSKYEAQGYTVETKPSGELGEDVFDLSGDLVKTQQIIMAAMEKAEKVLSGPWVTEENEITEQIDKLTDDIQSVFLNAVSEQVANIIRGRGSRVHMTRRNPEVWKGYEEDPEIAIAKYIRGLSGGEAKRNASIKMLQAMTGTDIAFKDFQRIEKAKGNTVDRTDYMKFIRERMIDARQQKNAFKWAKAYISEMTRNREMADEVIGFVKGLAVGKYLAFRVFSAPLVNITALPTSVVATLKGAGISYRQAWRYTARALKTYRQYLQHKKGKFISKEDQIIFKTIIEKGWDNPQFSSESMQTLRSQLGKTWDRVIDAGMWTFDQSERLNRVATIYAAYKGLKNIHKDKSASQLLDMAKELSDKSHGVYNKGNHPYIALGNNPAAKLAQMFYVFRTFSHTYLLNMKRLGLDKQWGAVAHMAVMPAVLAGAGASVMTPIISGLLKAFGLVDEPEEEMYAKIAESFGLEAEAWARHGLVGLGGRGASIKGSLAIGIGDLPTKIEDLFGAPGSIGKDIYYGAKSLRRGDVSKGLEKWSPTGIGNILRSYREYNEGLTTWNNAPKFYGAEPLKASKSEAFMRAFSLSPARLAGISEKQWKERKVEEKYRQWRTDIYAKIKRYIIEGGDDEQWAKIIAEIIKFNEQAERWYLSPITSKSIRMNIKRMYRISKREKLRR